MDFRLSSFVTPSVLLGNWTIGSQGPLTPSTFVHAGQTCTVQAWSLLPPWVTCGRAWGWQGQATVASGGEAVTVVIAESGLRLTPRLQHILVCPSSIWIPIRQPATGA